MRTPNGEHFTNGLPFSANLVSHTSIKTLLVLLLVACTAVRVTRPVIKIGLVAPFEGQYRYVGYDAIYAARLALREANIAEITKGYQLDLVAHDDMGTIAGALGAARNLVRDPQVAVVIGHYRDKTTAAARELYSQAGLPLVVAGTVEGMTTETDVLCPLLGYLADHYLQEGGDVLPSPYSIQLVTEFDVDFACDAKLAVNFDNQVPPAPGVEAVVLILDPIAAADTVVALREAGWEGTIAGGPTLGSTLFTQIAGPSSSGVIFVSPYRWPELDGRDAAFSVAYRSLGPDTPQPGPFALTTFLATQAVLAAIDETIQRGEVPSRQAMAQNLALSSNGEAFLYRWSNIGILKLNLIAELSIGRH